MLKVLPFLVFPLLCVASNAKGESVDSVLSQRDKKVLLAHKKPKLKECLVGAVGHPEWCEDIFPGVNLKNANPKTGEVAVTERDVVLSPKDKEWRDKGRDAVEKNEDGVKWLVQYCGYKPPFKTDDVVYALVPIQMVDNFYSMMAGLCKVEAGQRATRAAIVKSIKLVHFQLDNDNGCNRDKSPNQTPSGYRPVFRKDGVLDVFITGPGQGNYSDCDFSDAPQNPAYDVLVAQLHIK